MVRTRNPRPLAVLATAGLLAGAVLTAAPAASAADEITASHFRLEKTANSGLIDDLDAELPNVSVPTVVGDGNRVATRCSPNASHVVIGFCWNSGDDGTSAWYPQGLTTTADAYGAGTYDGATVIAASWYDHADDGIDKGVRVSFVDWSDPSSPTYRHVLLVEPYTNSSGRPSFRSIDIHAGGMFWYGHYLYVADTWNGFRVFDMRHLWRVSTGDKRLIGRQSNGSYHAHNYKYVLPQRFRYLSSTEGGAGRLRFSFAGLDRTSTPDSVLVGEYGYPGNGTRVVRFGIDYRDRLLRTDSDGYAHGDEAYRVDVTSMQGAAAIGGRFYLSTSDDNDNKGDLGIFDPGESVVLDYNALAIGPEDLAYWADEDQLWTLSEHPNQRNVYAIRPSAW